MSSPTWATCLVLGWSILGCEPPVAYTVIDPTHVTQSRASTAELYFASQPPTFDYRVVGRFQEPSHDALPGYQGFAMLGAEQGCDAVIVGGNVSRWSGGYENRFRYGESIPATLAAIVLSTLVRSDHPVHIPSRDWLPAFEELGRSADCVVRTDGAISTRQVHIAERYPIFSGQGN